MINTPSHASQNLKTFSIDITRVSYAARTFDVIANNLEEARTTAMDQAGNHDFKESSADYQFSDNLTDEESKISQLEAEIVSLRSKLAEIYSLATPSAGAKGPEHTVQCVAVQKTKSKAIEEANSILQSVGLPTWFDLAEGLTGVNYALSHHATLHPVGMDQHLLGVAKRLLLKAELS